jgi:hypothetical protein
MDPYGDRLGPACTRDAEKIVKEFCFLVCRLVNLPLFFLVPVLSIAEWPGGPSVIPAPREKVIAMLLEGRDRKEDEFGVASDNGGRPWNNHGTNCFI